MAKQNITITGIKDVKRLIRQGDKKVIQAARMAVQDVTATVAAEADDFVPFDEGELKGSQIVEMPTGTGRNIVGTISYGGTSAPYAVVQHENLDFYHPAEARGGTGPAEAPAGKGTGAAKFLEYPATQAFLTYEKKIVELIKRLIP
jgi:hypothetical protein